MFTKMSIVLFEGNERNHPSSGLIKPLQFTSRMRGKSKKTWRLF
jgi:hypothetical protein